MSHSYLPLSQGAERLARLSRPPLVLLTLSITVNLFLVYIIFCGAPISSSPFEAERQPLVFSPAHDIITYQAKRFDRGFQNSLPVYEQLPSPEVDEAWRELTRYTVSKISKSEAQAMANHTYPLIHENGYYMTGLDVFHQLHCLDMLRQMLYPDYYAPAHSPHHEAHMQHCVGHVRQALMCNADITPIVWQWEENAQLVRRKDDVPHECKNFDRVHEWAKERYYYVDDEDMAVFAPDDL